MPDLSCLQAFHSWDKSDFNLGGKTAGLVEMTCKDCLIRDLLYLFLTTSLWIPYPVVVQVNLRLCAIGAFLGIFYAELTLGFFFFLRSVAAFILPIQCFPVVLKQNLCASLTRTVVYSKH